MSLRNRISVATRLRFRLVSSRARSRAARSSFSEPRLQGSKIQEIVRKSMKNGDLLINEGAVDTPPTRRCDALMRLSPAPETLWNDRSDPASKRNLSSVISPLRAALPAAAESHSGPLNRARDCRVAHASMRPLTEVHGGKISADL